MAFFPDRLMPKGLKPETSYEVDDSPSIVNARDWNRHHREIISVEKTLLGAGQSSGAASGITGFSCYDFSNGFQCPGINLGGNPISIQDAINLINDLVDKVTNAGLFAMHCGTITSGKSVPIPPQVPYTTCVAPLGFAATSIPVASTEGFPQKGYITKFNNSPSWIECMIAGVPPVLGHCGAGDKQFRNLVGLAPIGGAWQGTNQEFIKYASKTATSFDGCTRGYAGTMAQDLVNNGLFNTTAVIMSGRASVAYTHNFWGVGKGTDPRQVVIEHDSMLNAVGRVLKEGTAVKLQELPGLFEIAYCLTVLGQFDDIDLSGILGQLEL
jgi:hypothetical protein